MGIVRAHLGLECGMPREEGHSFPDMSECNASWRHVEVTHCGWSVWCEGLEKWAGVRSCRCLAEGSASS